jgi:hypothetical protein
LQEKLLAETDARTRAEQEAQVKARERARAEAQAAAEAQARLRAQERAAEEAAARARLEERLRAETEQRARLEASRESEVTDVAAAVGTCDCCGKDNLAASNLIRIDSGQLFCTDCLAELRG